MNTGSTIFTQLMEFVPRYEFRQCVERYQGNFKVKSFACWDQFQRLIQSINHWRASGKNNGFDRD